MTTPLGDFGFPPDDICWGALLVAVLAAALSQHPGVRHAVSRISDRALVAALSLTAALLSIGYVERYLHGGPRIIDATAYFLEARTFASGAIAFDAPEPSGSFRGRFLLPTPDGHALAPIFPPGYPALLSLGFWLGHPMLVGPAIAAALVPATYGLSLLVFEDRLVARLAAVCSTCCAVLRYHTADTMSHGWSALLLAVSLAAALSGSTRASAFSGAAAGWLFATRPVSGIVALGVAAWTVGAPRGRAPGHARRALLALLSFASGPCALFFLHQRLATGAWLSSLQQAYYAVADGPPGCFRYGFGAGIGCMVEHGDFVRSRLPHGFGLAEALGTTLRRVKMHLADAQNAELFFPILLYALLRAPRSARPLKSALVAIVLLYAPFYFDGNFPGGGARFFADALPLEHALLSWGLLRLGIARWLVPVAFLGFAVHTGSDHLKLAGREGGRPMFEPRVLEGAGVRRGLVFVETDHGFLLGHDPGARDARASVVVARRRHDAHDLELWESLGRPETFAYEYAPLAARAEPTVSRVSPAGEPWARYEVEAEWPPLAVTGGWAEPVFPPCASGGRALALHPLGPGSGPVAVRLGAPAPTESGAYAVRLGVVGLARSSRVRLALGGSGLDLHAAGSDGGECRRLESAPVTLGREARLLAEITCDDECLADFIELAPLRAESRP